MSVGWGQCVDGVEVELWGECYNIEETTSISLYSSGIVGEIPPEIGNLINLVSLNNKKNSGTYNTIFIKDFDSVNEKINDKYISIKYNTISVSHI